MSNVSAKKVFIKIESAAEQQVSALMASMALRASFPTAIAAAAPKAGDVKEHLKNQRKTLKVLQSVATDKENLAGRPQIDKLSRIKAATDITLASTTADYAKRKKLETRTAETQTSPIKNNKAIVTVEDLTSSDKPSESYWEKLAEKRREALNETLTENQRLNERIEGLEEELNTSRQMLDEARALVEVLTEMLNENEAEREIESEKAADDEETRSSVTEEAVADKEETTEARDIRTTKDCANPE